jgi:hypothetical protein
MTVTTSSKENLPSPVMDERRTNRLTATEIIGGIECRIVLEKDASGQYREVMLTPITAGQRIESRF